MNITTSTSAGYGGQQMVVSTGNTHPVISPATQTQVPGAPPVTTNPMSMIYPNYSRWQSGVTGGLRVALVIVAVILEIIAIQQGSFLKAYQYQAVWNGICVSNKQK